MNAREDQEIAGKAYDVELARRLWRFIRPHRKVFILSVLLLPVHQCFNLAQPLLLKAGIDAIGAGDGFTLITTGILFFAALLAEGAAAGGVAGRVVAGDVVAGKMARPGTSGGVSSRSKIR